jgi:phage terminase large subunit-like protein
VRAFPLGLLEEAAEVLPDAAAWDWFLKGLSAPVTRALYYAWAWQAHGGQRAPEGEWRTWLLMAGRGFGKTRAGAEWLLERIAEAREAAEGTCTRTCPQAEAGTRTSTCPLPLRIALVGASRDEAAKVMVEGPSGLLALAREDDAPAWFPTLGTLRFPGGAEAFVYSGANPDGLRGPEHHFAWCDEIAKWRYPEAAWDNLQMGLRLGERPRAVVTTTPRRGNILARLRALAGTVETGGRTEENAHLPDAFVAWARETYGGTRLGRQELDGVLLEDVEGALWTREIIERARHAGALPAWKRVVVGVDPPASAHGDACGIVVCGLGVDGLYYVLADCTLAGARPEQWARAVARTADAWGAHRVVAEKNNGGDMVESVLRGVEPGLPVRLVHASDGKAARAEPVAALFEAGKARLAGRFPALEDELAGFTARGGYAGSRSPDRGDALVWAMTELARPRAEPRIRML